MMHWPAHDLLVCEFTKSLRDSTGKLVLIGPGRSSVSIEQLNAFQFMKLMERVMERVMKLTMKLMMKALCTGKGY